MVQLRGNLRGGKDKRLSAVLVPLAAPVGAIYSLFVLTRSELRTVNTLLASAQRGLLQPAFQQTVMCGRYPDLPASMLPAAVRKRAFIGFLDGPVALASDLFQPAPVDHRNRSSGGANNPSFLQ